MVSATMLLEHINTGRMYYRLLNYSDITRKLYHYHINVDFLYQTEILNASQIITFLFILQNGILIYI